MGFHTNVQTTKELYDTLLSIYPKLKPKDRGQWTDTTRKCKIKQGLNSDITTISNLTNHINNFHKLSSFEAHGNHLTFTSSTHEDNKPKLKSFLFFSISSFQFVIYVAIKYYFNFYLNEPTAYRYLEKFIRDIDEKMHNLRN